MADKSDNSISLDALVDKGSNKIIFVESDSDFADVLFSFLTIPMGTIIRLGRSHSIPVKLGSMKNLYSSVEKMDVQKYWSATFKEMLLLPKNAAEYLCNNLKLKIDKMPPTRFRGCRYCFHLEISYECKLAASVYWQCPECKVRSRAEYKFFPGASQVEGVFLKEQTRLIVTDDLQVVSPFAKATKLFTQLGVSNTDNTSTTEELTLNIGVDEVVNLLLRSLVSKTPFTDILLKHKIEPQVSNETLDLTVYVESRMLIADTMHPINEENEQKIPLKLTVSKSKNVVCYAQAQEDFVNLLFSFLTLPLGCVVKHMRDDSFEGCIDKLYKTVQDLQEPYLKSSHHREMLLNPKLVPGFCYENSPLGIEETSYYLMKSPRMLTTDKSLIPSNKMRVLGPRYSVDGKQISPPGFLKGQAVFTVTDDLVVRPISTMFELSVLQELKVPFTDIEDRVVHVGRKEALHLLVASFVGESVLTKVFMKETSEYDEETLVM